MKRVWKKIKVTLFSVVLMVAFTAGCSSTKSTSDDFTQAEQETKEESSQEAVKTENTKDESELLHKIKEKGVLTVASSNDAPFAYIDVETGEFEGIDAVIIKEIAKRLGIPKVVMKEVAFENLLIELNNKTVDMVTDAMYIKDERLQKALFTNAWYQEGEGIIIPNDSSITAKEDLKQATLGGQKGTTFLETAQAWVKEGKVKEVSIFGKQTELMMAVNTGKIDACITDGIVAAYTLAQDSSLNLKILSPYESEASGKIGAAIRFEDQDFLYEVNTVLDEMKEDGTLMDILEDFGLNEDYFVDVEDGITQNKK
ncbi:polar amino acid transport system substrate-binding protein [Lachnotalea glycerini]|uniref:Amino acid ABC transporter substrate-binding protein n=1 Tax=Lachnotalea glycerini TaxID=1763509 RepID=A0A255IAY1_9FIRM|nr:ABC transporter substrate-binding protein [Lachnotalea glycerini]PXV96161.1 polar amino acid transport system substrate-binding protein [Lachnotalea glycerini]RDY27499.1 amino acid ABC transporter substrate-binding protein [Lachnotalea glycerini]